MFSLFQRHRNMLVDFLKNNPNDADIIMEAVSRTVTFTGNRTRPFADADDVVVALAKRPRHWRTMNMRGCFGRFVPDTESRVMDAEGLHEVDLFSTSMPKSLKGESFVEWMRRVTTLSVDTEVNVQLGDFTLKKHVVRVSLSVSLPLSLKSF